MKLQDKSLFLKKFFEKVCNHLNNRYKFGPDINSLILDFLILDYIVQNKQYFYHQLKIYFDECIPVFLHVKIKQKGLTYDIITQRLYDYCTFIDYLRFQQFITGYVQTMGYLKIYPEGAICYHRIYETVLEMRLHPIEYVTIIGFTLTAFYWCKFTNQFQTIEMVLLSQ